MTNTRPKILLALLAAAAFLPFLGRRDIVTSHEARVVQTARQMAESGWPWQATPAAVPAVRLGLGGDAGNALTLTPDPAAEPLHVNPWLVPVLNDQVRLQKPPLPYWCSAILFKLAGQWSEALARFIPAMLGALCTLLIYDLARLLLGRRFALPAALVWVTSYFVLDEFRKVMADPYLAFFALAAVWGWVRAAVRHSPSALLVFYVSTALGLLAKGPVLFIHLAIPIALFHLLRRRRRPPGPVWSHLLGLALLLAIALPWPLYVLNHVPHAREIWRYESLERFAGNDENPRPFWYYLPQLFLITLPWTPVFLLAVVLPFRKRGARQSGLPARRARPVAYVPLCWFALVLLTFSCIVQKKNAYLLPAMPAATLMTAQGIVFAAAALRRRRRVSRPKFDEVLIAAALVLVVAMVAVFTFARTPAENARSPRPASAFIGMALANDPHTTVIPAKLPVEATLYLPLDISYDPRASTILYLIDQGHYPAKASVADFAQRLPDLNIVSVTPVPIPRDGARHRYQLFRLTVAPGTSKQLANATPH